MIQDKCRQRERERPKSFVMNPRYKCFNPMTSPCERDRECSVT